MGKIEKNRGGKEQQGKGREEASELGHQVNY
jgi:hypothetical protein